MAIANLSQELIMWGFVPFMPQLGIYCGGFQGPLYPNPTTLVLQSIRDQIEPLDFRDEAPTAYVLNAYVGLGKGNPGIDYRNPGHTLGLLDTFLRMSYGLNVIKGIRESVDNRSPIIDTEFKKRTAKDYLLKVFNNNDLYPSLSEVPTDYIEGIDIIFSDIIKSNGKDMKNIELEIEDENKLHIPIANEITFSTLFDDVHTDSYFDMILPLRKLFSNLLDEVQSLENIVFINFDSTPTREIPSSLRVGVPTAISPFSEGAGTLGLQTSPGVGETINSTSSKTQYFNTNKAISGPINLNTGVEIINNKALEFFNKNGKLNHTSEIKDSNGDLISLIMSHQSLAELNAVMNILPIQINGYKSTLFVNKTIGDQNRFDIEFVVNVVCDLILNLNHDSSNDGTININGDASFSWQGGGFDSIADLEALNRRFFIKIINTNKFIWDRPWFELSQFEDKFTDEKKNSFELEPGSPPDLNFTFNEDVDIKTGGNSVIVRLYGTSAAGANNNFEDSDPNTLISNGGDELTINISAKDDSGNTIVSKSLNIDSTLLGV